MTSTTPPPTHILSIPSHPQPSSPLFSLLPPEIRSEIFSYALADFPDPDPKSHYAPNTCFTRPSYFAPRKTDTALLQTCRAVYAEAWHLPFLLKEQTHWLSTRDRQPPEYRKHSIRGTVPLLLQQRLAAMADRLGGGQDFEIESLRVFAQMYKLEEGALAALLGTPGLRPRRLVLTLRHADWWFWERDEPLRIEGQKWVEGVCRVLPGSVREVTVELESLERKRGQVDGIAKQMRERWFFRRVDGTVLYADASGGGDEVTRWTGTSTWNKERWVRDETEEGRTDYYVLAMSFRPEHVVQRRDGVVSGEAREAAEKGEFGGRFRLFLANTTRLNTVPASVRVHSVSPPQFGYAITYRGSCRR